MPDPTIVVQGLVRPVALRVDAGTSRVVVAERDGRLLFIDVATGQQTGMVPGPGPITAFDLSPDGQSAYVAGTRIGVWRVPLDGSSPTRLIRNAARPGAVVAGPTGDDLIVVEGQSPGRVLHLTFQPPQGTTVARGVRRARGAIMEQATGRILVAEAMGGGRLVLPQANGPATVLASGLGRPADLAWTDQAETQAIGADTGGNRVIRLDLAQPAGGMVELYGNLMQLWGARPYPPDQMVIGAGDALLIAGMTPGQGYPVEMTIPSDELFISGWVTVPVTIHDPSVTFEDIDFVIEPRESAAMVSVSRDNSFDPAQPTILLSAGWMTGAHELVAVHRVNGTELGRAAFKVLDTWSDPDLGPSIATFGSVISGPDSGTWGGADSGNFTVPQNIAVHPAVGTRNIGVVLVDTASARYPTGAALTTIINDLRDEIVNGVTVGGQVRSVAAYFNEASNGLFNINLVDVFGPVALPNAWSSYFTMDATSGDWIANEDLDTTVIAALVGQNANITQVDSLIYVVRSRVNPPNPDLFVWPRASLTTKTQIVAWLDIGIATLPVFRGVARIMMPDDWVVRRPPRQFHETLAHELFHNFGLIDQYDKAGYTADAMARITGPTSTGANPTGTPAGTWEMMTWEQDLPLPSAAHRLMLGWLDPASVRLYNFGVFGPADETITLHAAAAGPVPAGRFGAAEVRLEDGKNFYFEYRPGVAGRLPDANPPDATAVLGTEALTRLPEPTDRAQILLVREDVDAVVEEGSFVTGEDFRDRDTTTPGFEQDFIVDVTNTTADAATIRVRYAPDSKPDPGITPWSPSSNWQSPDLEVINGRNQFDMSFKNIPWEGHDNTVQARVTNNGSSDAHGVTVKFFAKDFTFGGGAEIPLGEQTRDVPVGPPVTFTAPDPWRPPQLVLPLFQFTYQQHACVVARMDPFLDPVSNIWEVTPENNEAQSNYTWAASSTSSPATREVTTILAANPFDKPATITFTIRQPHPLFRVYLDHRWVRLEPGEQRRVLLMVESLLGDPRFAGIVEEFEHGERRIETTLRLSAYGDTWETCAPSLIGGIAVRVMTGYGTRFEHFETDGGLASGFIVQTDTGMGVDGTVVVSVLPRDPDDPQPELVREGEVHGGEFRVELGRAGESWRIQAHYLGRFPWAPCESEVIEQ